MTSDWTTPADIENQLRRLWNRGRILANRFEAVPLFPLRLRFRAPGSKALADEFDAAREWIRTLELGSCASRGYGYEIIWREVNHRQLGRNAIPGGIGVATEADAVRLIGKSREAEKFFRLAEATLSAFPALRGWLADKPLTALDYADEWDKVLTTLAWFRTHPRSGLYLRQLDVPGVDTKFIELRRGLLSELLDLILPPEAIDGDAFGAKGFEQRFGLRSKPPLVRFRLLDPGAFVAGLSDLSAPAAQLAGVPLPVRRVFITENEINGLAFPQARDSMVIFGLGYGLDRLHEIAWLREKEIHYWGDIDTHGFAILNRLRAGFPNARSMLMDSETLLAHRPLWVREEKPFTGDIERLTESERSTFENLRSDRFGKSIRLEQERVAFSHVERHLRAIIGD